MYSVLLYIKEVFEHNIYILTLEFRWSLLFLKSFIFLFFFIFFFSLQRNFRHPLASHYRNFEYRNDTNIKCKWFRLKSVTWYAPEKRKSKIYFPFPFCVWTNMTCNRVDREENVVHWLAWPDEIEMRKKGAKWLAEAFSAESSTFSSEEIWKRIFSFRTAAGVKRRDDLLVKTPEKEWNRIFGQKITVPSARF